jgi:hypothetical protein
MPALGNIGGHTRCRVASELLTHCGEASHRTSQDMLAFSADPYWNPMDHALVAPRRAYNHTLSRGPGHR